ncbi:hypothetical protein D3C81_968000 [compost metagenome]
MHVGRQGDDLVGPTHGHLAMGRHQNGAAACMRSQRLQQVAFGLRVEERGGFVEQEQVRITQQQPRQTNPPGLSAGQTKTTLADHRVQTLRQVLGEAHHLRDLGHRLQSRVADRRVRQAQVVGNAAVEQVRPLPGIADACALAQDDPALARRQPPGQRFQQGALAAAARAGQRQALAFGDIQREVRQHVVMRTLRAQCDGPHTHHGCMPLRRLDAHRRADNLVR